MAKINPVKVKQDAERLEKEGKLDKAIALYRQITDDNSRDWNTINKIGDLYAKLNRTREASEEYAKVADFYAKDGFLLKAIALWKKINRLDPTALDPYLNLADLYAKQGLMMEAKSQYQIVVDEYIKRGRARDAGDVLKKMADIDPSDLKIQSKLADLYIREGSTGKAIEVHVGIAEELTKKGHLNEALQVLEKGLKIDAKNLKLRGEIARVHLVQKNYEKAAQHLEEIVQRSPDDTQMLFRLGEAYLGSKKIEEAEAIFKRLLELNPDDGESHVQMGRVFLLQGRPDDAYEEFVPVVDKLLERKEGDKAAALLQQIVQKSSSHAKTLAKLVEVYRVLRKDLAVAQTYSQLTEAYINDEQFEEAAAVLEILVSMEPQNAQHRTKLEFVRNKQKGGGGAPAARTKAAPPAPKAAPAEVLEEEFEIPSSDEAPAFLGFEEEDVAAATAAPARAPAAPPARVAIEASGPLADEDKEFIDEHLAEGRVFRKYGLVDKAADQFEAVVARFPDNLDARIELRDVFKEKGQAQKAAEQCLAIAEIHRMGGDPASAATFEEEARSLAPGAAPSPAAAPAPQPRPKAAPAKAPAVEAVPEEAEGEVDISVDLEEGGIEPAPEVAEEAPEVASFDLDVDDAAGGDLPEQFVDEPEPLAVDEPAVAAEVSPAAEESEVSFAPAEEEISLEEPVVEEPEPAPPPPPPRPAPPRAQPAAPPPPARPRLPPDLQKTLDEVDSYVSLGFVDDAKDALREVMGRHPGHAAIAAKIADLGLDLEEEAPPVEKKPVRPALRPAKAPAQRPSPIEDALSALAVDVPEPALPSAASLVDENALPEAAPEPEGGIDLGAELGDLFSAQSAVEEAPPETSSTDLGDAGLADIFKEFKKGVDKQLGKEDYDTRYNLGIAYKEMGLVDEAIAEFQLAAKDENRILECSSMLGICFMEKGMPKLAVKWFEKGLKAPGRSPEEYLGLRYDLAMAHEAAGEADTALEIFTEIHGEDAGFRDVAAKVRDLRVALG